MIHMVQINDDDYLDIVKAADDAKMTIEQFEAWCIAAGVSNYRRHQRCGTGDVEDYGFIPVPGGD